MAKLKTLRCPTCRTIVLVGSDDFPFCSDRCRLIDLGKWASGGYVISSPIHDPDLLEPGPGTYGSVAAVLLWYGAAHGFALGWGILAAATAVAAIAATLIGI